MNRRMDGPTRPLIEISSCIQKGVKDDTFLNRRHAHRTICALQSTNLVYTFPVHKERINMVGAIHMTTISERNWYAHFACLIQLIVDKGGVQKSLGRFVLKDWNNKPGRASMRR